MTNDTEAPVAKAQMMIRKPVAEVFEALIDPAVTSHFWFSKGSGRLEAGKQIRWDWEMYGVGTTADVKTVDKDGVWQRFATRLGHCGIESCRERFARVGSGPAGSDRGHPAPERRVRSRSAIANSLRLRREHRLRGGRSE